MAPSTPPTHWAYSSIGQSPRLITGPFLVRTQVGPRIFRALDAHSPALVTCGGSAAAPPQAPQPKTTLHTRYDVTMAHSPLFLLQRYRRLHRAWSPYKELPL